MAFGTVTAPAVPERKILSNVKCTAVGLGTKTAAHVNVAVLEKSSTMQYVHAGDLVVNTAHNVVKVTESEDKMERQH